MHVDHTRLRAQHGAVAPVQAEELEERAQAVMRAAARHDRPGLAAPRQQAFDREIRQRAAHRADGDAETLRQRHLARQHRARRPAAHQDRFGDVALHHLVKRHSGHLVETAEFDGGFRCGVDSGHGEVVNFYIV